MEWLFRRDEVSPGIDLFVGRRVSLGIFGAVVASGEHLVSRSGSSFERERQGAGGGVRVGVALPLAGPASLYPRVAISAGYVRTREHERGAPRGRTLKYVYSRISLSLPLVFEIAPHALVGVGPTVAKDVLGGAASGTHLGAAAFVGAWL